MPRKITRSKPLKDEPTNEQREARDWGINNGYIIGPLGINSRPDHYHVGIATVAEYAKVKKDPTVYDHTEVMDKVYEYYKYYYDKR